MKRMENDRNGLPSLQHQELRESVSRRRKGLLKNIPQHREPNRHVSARCHCHPLSTSVGWPQTPSCWKQLDTAPHTPTVCRMPRSRYAWTTLRVRHWSSTISLAKSDWTPLSRPYCIFHNQPAICHKQLWSCNPIGKETAPEFGTALFISASIRLLTQLEATQYKWQGQIWQYTPNMLTWISETYTNMSFDKQHWKQIKDHQSKDIQRLYSTETTGGAVTNGKPLRTCQKSWAMC